MDTSSTHRYEVKGGSAIVGQIRAWVSQIAEQLGASAQATADFALAVSEAATNVVRHSYRDAQEYHLIVTAQRIGEKIIFRLRDFGDKFDPAEVRPPEIDDEPSVGGYGIYLMRRVMDEVHYVTTHPVGTELILIRHRNR